MEYMKFGSKNSRMMPLIYIIAVLSVFATSVNAGQPKVTGTRDLFHKSTSTAHYRHFGDWVVACTNIGNCQVRGETTVSGTSISAMMLIKQSAGPRGELEAQMAFSPTLNRKNSVPDCAVSDVLGPGWSTFGNAQECDGFQSINEASVHRFIAKNMNEMEFSFIDRDGVVHRLSLKGFKAALLFVDEVQDRLNNETALIRRGPENANKVRAPVKVAAIPQAQIIHPLENPEKLRLAEAVFSWAKKNNIFSHENPEIGSIALYPLNAQEALALIATDNDGLHNAHFDAYRINRTDSLTPRAFVLPIVKENVDQKESVSLSNASYSAETQILNEHDQYGGNGEECGEESSWRFNGKQFALVSASKLDVCDSRPLDSMLTLWE